MPQIELVDVRLYEPTDPYNHQIDNIPIKGLIDRILLVNSQVDVDAQILSESQGTQGSLSNRLAQSINDDGSLKSTAIDEALHNIAEHQDGYVLIDGTPVSYVRMLYDERTKLSGIDSEANNLDIRVVLNVSVPSSIPSQISVIGISEIEFTEGEFRLKPSDSIYWEVDTTGAIKANTTFPASVRLIRYYDQVPVPQDTITPDYKNYAVTSTNTPYKAGSLRVYINGVRITREDNITPTKAPHGTYVPTDLSSGTPTWLIYSFSEGDETSGVVTSGEFSLSSAITDEDVITVDFDVFTS